MWTTPPPFWEVQDAEIGIDNKKFGGRGGKILKRSPFAKTSTPNQTLKIILCIKTISRIAIFFKPVKR
jgi:hypothetical protein